MESGAKGCEVCKLADFGVNMILCPYLIYVFNLYFFLASLCNRLLLVES